MEEHVRTFLGPIASNDVAALVVASTKDDVAASGIRARSDESAVWHLTVRLAAEFWRACGRGATPEAWVDDLGDVTVRQYGFAGRLAEAVAEAQRESDCLAHGAISEAALEAAATARLGASEVALDLSCRYPAVALMRGLEADMAIWRDRRQGFADWRASLGQDLDGELVAWSARLFRDTGAALADARASFLKR